MKRRMNKKIAILALSLIGSAAFVSGAAMSANYTAAADEAYANATIEMMKGASVRYIPNATDYTESGIRFSAHIESKSYQALEAMEATEGVSVSYGMLIAPYEYFKAHGEFDAATVFGVGGDKKYTWEGDTATADGLIKIAHVTYEDLIVSAQEGYENYHAINGSLINIKSENLTREFVGRGYICYEHDGVKEYKFASYVENDNANNARSIVYVSQLAIEKKDAAAEWVQGYVSKVENVATTYTVETYVGDELVKSEAFDTTVNAKISNVAVKEYEGFENVSAQTSGVAYANGNLVLKHVYAEIADSKYQVKNGGFETGDLTGWTLNGEIGAVSNETHYWENDPISADGFAFGLDGTYMFSAYAIDGLEGNMGTLKSSTFTVSESGWITYKLGGAKNSTYVHVDVVEAATGNILKRYYNQNHKYKEVGNIRLGCELNAYKADLTDCIGKEVYLRIGDYASADFGLFFLDSVDTLHLAEPNASYVLANEVAHQNTIYDLYNGNFDKDMDGWTKSSNIGDISEDTTYWTEAKPFDNVGKFFSCYAPDQSEGSTGTLRSNVFEVGGSGYITYRIGGVKHPDQVYMEVIDAVSGVKYGHFYNEYIADCTLVSYKADLSAYIGKLVYINFVDKATGDYGLIFCDEFVTYYANEADVPAEYNVAVNKVESIYNVMNGGFETGNLLGWTLVDGSEPGFVTNKDGYWNQGYSFDKDGTWLYTGLEVVGHGSVEGNMGTLRSNTFLVKENSVFSFKFGGARWEGTYRNDVYIRLVKADGTEIARYYNENGSNEDSTRGRLVSYSYDLNNEEEMACYIEICDYATSGWGLLAVDAFSITQKA